VTIIATGVGSTPGTDMHEAIRIVLGEVPDLPHLPELPGRGVTAGMVGRTLGAISDLGFDLQPAGWRLTDAPGVDHRRAASLLAQDLDALEELTEGFEGPLKIQLAGPWTLAAMVEKPRGDKVLSDVGARRDLAQALAEGVRRHLADVQRRVPGAQLLLQVDEPLLPAVMAGEVRTASGFHRHRSVDPPQASALLEEVLVPGSIVHSCAAGVPVGLVRGAGAGGVSLAADLLGAASYDDLGTLLDAGDQLFLGVVTTGRTPTARAIADRVQRLLDMLGFGPDDVADQLVLTPACGLAGVTDAGMRQVLGALREAAGLLNRG
jgi:hypothetical protein